MTWVFVGAIALALFAGAGGKWLVDRVWPPEAERLAAYDRGFVEGRTIVAAGPRPKLTALDDTMEVYGAAYEAGLRMGRHARPDFSSQHLATGLAPEPEPGPAEVLEQLEPLPASMIYRDDPAVPAEQLTAEYAEKASWPPCTTAPPGTGMPCLCEHACDNYWLRYLASGQQPAGGGI